LFDLRPVNTRLGRYVTGGLDLLLNNGLALRLSPTVRASVTTDEAGFDLLAREWDQLVDESDQRVYFLRWAWNRLWWRLFRPRGAGLFLITCRDEQGRLLGLAPFYLKQRSTAGIPHVREVSFIGTGVYARTSEYLDIIARRGHERAVADCVAEFLRGSDEWDRLCLDEVPSHSAMLPHFQRALGEHARTVACSRSHHIDVTTDWETFKQGLGRSTRKHLMRQTRRFSESFDCRFQRVEAIEELAPAIDALVKLHQARWTSKGQPGSFALPGMEELLRGAARVGLAEGRLRLWTLKLSGQVVAVRIAFLDNGIVHAIQGGFDPAYTKESLGSVMLGLCIKDCIEDESVREYDFMGGADSYKDWWSKSGRETVTLTCLRPGIRSAAYNGIGRATVLGKSLLRATVPQPIRRAGHKIMERRHYSRAV
jgi:CelD/BcsL family acetyltransferase involved in cellulose biosynthesis